MRSPLALALFVAATAGWFGAACVTSVGPLTRQHLRPVDRAAAPADAAYLDELLGRAHQLNLADRVEWQRLGHWHRGVFGGYQSQADGPNFFLAAGGASSPGDELDATLRGFFATLSDAPDPTGNVQHPICQFPARYRWLDRQLAFDPRRLAKPPCPRFDEFVSRVDADHLALVFSSYYLNNPASVFGHTFVRIVKRGKHGALTDDGQRDLLDYAVEFSATVDTPYAVVYAFKGLTGMFPGTFRNVPFHFKVRQYNDYESRDLYEYDLNFTRDEIDMFLAHLWELGSTFFDYFYVSENCSYHLLGALEAARPELALLDHMHWPVIPADAVKALYANPGLVSAVHFRPSLRRQFTTRVHGLDGEQRDALAELAYRPATPLPAQMPGDRAIAVLDAAQDLVDLQHTKEIAHALDSPPARIKQQLLERRAAITVASPPLEVATPWRSMPQLGHASRRLGVGLATDDTGARAVALDARLALHDLADPVPGYPESSQLEFLPARARIRFDDDVTGRKRFQLDSLSLVRIVSLTPHDRFDNKMSWKVDVGVVRQTDAGCDGACYLGQAALGTGGTLATSGGAVIAFAMVDAHVATGPALDGIAGAALRAGFGPSGGLRLRLTDQLVSLTTGEWIWLPGQTPRATWQARSILRWGLADRFALSLESQLDNHAATATVLSMWYL